ncbi:unnamed protein product [Adineta ricciae]|uniref:Attractin/MKLN-like beta-propeller domain-containing protein n=1 Tax=Adineta ricciae TaxID=249248 RepID=A0A814ER49_ADIRI|nr:unnamed protein product [Adineta ricciae]CAF1468099.1 unnamed protein product [Adineta ricciae]
MNTSVNSSSVFVSDRNEVYFDSYSTVGGVSRLELNSTHSVQQIQQCQQCFDIFLDSHENLFCSITVRHQVLSRSLVHSWNPFIIVAGTASKGSTATTLSSPKGIFVDPSNGDLFVADCGNDRVQLFRSESLVAQTAVGNKTENVTYTLSCPSSIILDANKLLFIVDSINERIIRQTPNGFSCILGCGSSPMSPPTTIAFDSLGNLFLVNQTSHQLIKFPLINTKSAGWVTTGNMNVPRCQHTATMLPDGKVLVTGGQNGAGSLNSVELYDLSTGNWTTANSMSVGRQLHTATTLSNGKVLVTGGWNIATLDSTELYDPSTGNWTTAYSMSDARIEHTATMLSNGKVLVTGGQNDRGYLNSAEIYDPSTDSWTPANNMSISRYQHTATMLSIGKVLVTGGQNGGYLTSAESYE